MDHAGHRERLRKRYLQEGLASFAPHEALELLLTFAIPRVNTNPLAHELIDRFGSLNGVLEASPGELSQVKGIGPQAATLLSMLLPILRMYEQDKLLPRRRISTYAEMSALCRTLFLGVKNEQFYVLGLDSHLNLLSVKLLSQGTPSQVSLEPRRVVEELLRCGAAGAVITHNHPSGSPEPSQADVDITLEIQSLLAGLDIRLYDHVLIAGNKDYSFFSNRWLSREPEEDVSQAADEGPRVLPLTKEKK